MVRRTIPPPDPNTAVLAEFQDLVLHPNRIKTAGPAWPLDEIESAEVRGGDLIVETATARRYGWELFITITGDRQVVREFEVSESTRRSWLARRSSEGRQTLVAAREMAAAIEREAERYRHWREEQIARAQALYGAPIQDQEPLIDEPAAEDEGAVEEQEPTTTTRVEAEAEQPTQEADHTAEPEVIDPDEVEVIDEVELDVEQPEGMVASVEEEPIDATIIDELVGEPLEEEEHDPLAIEGSEAAEREQLALDPAIVPAPAAEAEEESSIEPTAEEPAPETARPVEEPATQETPPISYRARGSSTGIGPAPRFTIAPRKRS